MPATLLRSHRRLFRFALTAWAATAAHGVWWAIAFASAPTRHPYIAVAAGICVAAACLTAPYARHNLRQLRRLRSGHAYCAPTKQTPADAHIG